MVTVSRDPTAQVAALKVMLPSGKAGRSCVAAVLAAVLAVGLAILDRHSSDALPVQHS